jgi:hypothetical protein
MLNDSQILIRTERPNLGSNVRGTRIDSTQIDRKSIELRKAPEGDVPTSNTRS